MAEEKSEPKFSIVKLIPITLVISIMSQISVISYYHNFNFSPITYLESYEILFSSVKDFVCIAVLAYLNYQILLLIISKITRKERSNITLKQARQYRLSLVKTYYIFSLVLLATLVATFFHDSTEPHILFVIRSFFTTFILTFLVIANTFIYMELVKFRDNNAKSLKKYFPYVNPLITLAVAISIISLVAISTFKYTYVKKHNPYKGSELTIEEGVIKCTSKVIFIGKSQKYYFIYNTPDKSVRVVKRDDIKKEVIKIDPNVNFFYRF